LLDKEKFLIGISMFKRLEGFCIGSCKRVAFLSPICLHLSGAFLSVIFGSFLPNVRPLLFLVFSLCFLYVFPCMVVCASKYNG
jgi:hypothetical protein